MSQLTLTHVDSVSMTVLLLRILTFTSGLRCALILVYFAKIFISFLTYLIPLSQGLKLVPLAAR